MQILEREDASAQLDTALARARLGGALAFVSGEAGIGKTTLVRAFLARLDRDARVLAGACDDLAVPRPLGPFFEMASQAPGLGDDLVRDPVAAPAAVFQTIRRLAAPVCVIEDVHWADQATIDVLAHVARRIWDSRALVVVTYRDDEVGSAHPLRRLLAASPAERTHRIALGPLSPNAVARLAPDDPDAAGLHAVTGGNPFFLTQLLQEHRDAVPASVRDLVLGRRARLTPAARDLVDIVGLVPSRAELWLLDDCFDGSVADAGVACEAAGLLVAEGSALRFRHELARRVVEDAVPDVRRVALHRRLLVALGRHGAPAARLAHHARWADDPEALVHHGLEAATGAIDAHAHRETMALLEMVLDHGQLLTVAQRAEALEHLSEAAYHCARPDPAIPARHQALALRRELGEPSAISANLRWLSRLCWWARDRPGAERAADEAIAVLEGLPVGRELAMALSNRSQLAMLSQHDADAIALARRAIGLADDLGDTETLVHAQTNLGSTLARSDFTAGLVLMEESARRAADAGLEEHVCRAQGNAAWHALDEHHHVEARRLVDAGLGYALDHDQLTFAQYLTATRALVDLAVGRWDAAEAGAQQVIGAQEYGGNPVARVPALYVLGLIRLRRGNPDARELLAEAWELAVATEELQRIRPVACAMAEQAWLAGDPQRIDEVTREPYALALSRGSRWDIAELAVWRHRAAVLTNPPPDCPDPISLELDGEVLAAAARWRDLGEPYSEGLVLAQVDVAETLIDAVMIFDDLGATTPARILRARLQRLGARGVPRGPRPATRTNPAGLTPRQLEIAELLAGGLSNRQIAERLTLSERTVEHHVGAVLAKLDVRSRDDVAAILRDVAPQLR